MILNDKNNASRIIPLHKGNGLTKIQSIQGYDENMHKWISGDHIFEFLSEKNADLVKKYILKKLMLVHQ